MFICKHTFLQLEGKEIIRKVDGACLAGRLPWMTEGQAPVLQPIRANVSHFKKPWFDSVQVRRLGPRGESETAYAELRLLFEADVSTAGEDGVGLESKPEVMYCKLRILLFNSIHSILHVTHTHTYTHTHTH